ncbi:DUF969 domain-containing protein [Burkholderia glumae]|uniref:DUF969 domain-containing protein n=1 Tax=Burkholderia glumae TaxID=337 RepID=A0AAP9XXU5_BURGL|nr:DUF969 domain-containing protein [Burkholderia glumae]ACR32432.1 Hypothetical protein bglu_2g21250 [Burkholderia glumae BGR1]AJY62675.1 hypothetical protein KS03_3801 [Burkholderia glumae LMG 2196 = ATCC 33617]KHJ59973.1 membrane protein [Burkholderia glumae]MCM2484375.1 DUF969 domain-containing protein [Burkholderia glumae]MCM2510067.1 DUF969 domain-containing protein [Burkholderia glumae]
MSSAVNLTPLIGVALIAAGFALRFHPMLIVTLAAIATGLAAHFSPGQLLAVIGTGFLKTRTIPLIILLPLAVIGLLERHGLRERAQAWIGGIRAATPGRLLLAYLLARELTAALGLTGLGGHPQMVRPLVAPMAEGAAQTRFGPLGDAVRQRLRAFAASADNVGLFFGEDVFVAFGAIVLMVTFLREAGIAVEPMQVALYGLPTALAAFLVHGLRLWRLDGWLARQAASGPAAAAPGSASGPEAGQARGDRA